MYYVGGFLPTFEYNLRIDATLPYRLTVTQNQPLVIHIDQTSELFVILNSNVSKMSSINSL